MSELDHFQISERISDWLSRISPSEPQLINKIHELGIDIGTTIGNVREHNEDRLLVARFSFNKGRGFLLIALCDGMGGMSDGAKCAEIALGAIVQSLVTDATLNVGQRLRQAVMKANEEVYGRYSERGGTTFSGLIFSNSNRVYGVNVGDSRIYRYKIKDPREVVQISDDDTIAGAVARLRGYMPSDSEKNLFLDRLAQFIGVSSGLEPGLYDFSNHVDESSFLITSDGTHSLGRDTFASIVLNSSNSYECVRRLIYLSRWVGGHDNASVVCVPNYSIRKILFEKRDFAEDILELWSGENKFEMPVKDFLKNRQRAVDPLGIRDNVDPSGIRDNRGGLYTDRSFEEKSNEAGINIEKGIVKNRKKRSKPKKGKKKDNKKDHAQRELRIEVKNGADLNSKEEGGE